MDTFLQQIVNGLGLGSIYALIALGYTMVFGVLRMINFAHGDVFMLGAFGGYYFSKMFHGTMPQPIEGLLALVFSMLACAIVGMGIERFFYRPLRKASRLTVLIVSIGVSLLLEFGGQMLFGADPKFFPQFIAEHSYHFGKVVITNQQFAILGCAITLLIWLDWFIHRTYTGKAMRAVSQNIDSARLMGIDSDKMISLTFAIGSALAAAGGILVSLSQPSIHPLMGVMTGIKAFVAAVLGGIGNMTGAVIGGLLLGLAEVMVSGYGSSTWRDAIAFVILVFVLLIKPEGILGKAKPEKV